MKKRLLIFTSIFLTGLFAGLFWCTSLSSENSIYLYELLLSGLNSDYSGVISKTFSSLLSSFALILLMVPAVFTKYLCPLPPAVLLYKSFTLGFCCSLIHSYENQSAFLIVLIRFLPQNLFFIPAFIVLAAVFFSLSLLRDSQKNRLLHSESRNLLYASAAAVIFILLGAVIESVFRAAAL